MSRASSRASLSSNDGKPPLSARSAVPPSPTNASVRGNPAKARDKITLKMSKDGASERNLTSGEDTRVSKRSADFDLRGDSAEYEPFSQMGKSSKSKRKHRQHGNRPVPAEQGAAASEPQIANENSDEPKQPENVAISQITAADERQETRQDDYAHPNDSGGNSVVQQIVTGGKPPPKRSKKYADFTPPSDPAPIMPQSALKHEPGEPPLKTEQSSELQFTREEKQPKLSRKQKKRQQRQNNQNAPQKDALAPIADNADNLPELRYAPQSALNHSTSDNLRFEPQNAEIPPIVPPKRKPLSEFAAKPDTDIADTPLPDTTSGGEQPDIVTPPKTADAPESSLKTG